MSTGLDSNNSQNTLPQYNDGTNISSETKQKIFEKMKEMGLKTPTNKELNKIDSEQNGSNNNIEKIINSIIDNRQKIQDLKLRQNFKGLDIKEFLYNNTLINRWAELFEKTPDEIKNSISVIFNTRFGGEVSGSDFIKQTEIVKLLQNHFDNNIESIEQIGIKELDKLLKRIGISLEDLNNLKDKNNEAIFNGDKSLISFSNENEKGVNELIKLLNNPENKYIVEELTIYPPIIIIKIAGEKFHVKINDLDFNERMKKVFEDTESSNDDSIQMPEWIRNDRKSAINFLISKGLADNGHHDLGFDFEGIHTSEYKRRFGLLGKIKKMIVELENKSGKQFSDKLILGKISTFIVETLEQFENTNTLKTGNKIEDFYNDINNVISDKEVEIFISSFSNYINEQILN